MNQVNIEAIIAMADTNAVEFQEAGLKKADMFGSDTEIGKAVAEIMKKKKAEAAVAAAESLVLLIEEADSTILKHVSHLREIRRQETMVKASIEKISLAKAYATETFNGIPLMNMIGTYRIPMNVSEDKRTVPVGWKPKKKAG